MLLIFTQNQFTRLVGILFPLLFINLPHIACLFHFHHSVLNMTICLQMKRLQPPARTSPPAPGQYPPPEVNMTTTTEELVLPIQALLVMNQDSSPQPLLPA